jgi:hypothetical protein
MNYSNILAAGLRLDIDYDRMAKELLALMDHQKCITFSYPTDSNTEVTAYSIFIRKSPTELTEVSFRTAKSIDYDSWIWDYDLNIPYTRTVIGSMPFTKLGTVRIVFFPDVPCIEHTDWDNSSDHKHTLGLSIIPNDAGTCCNVWSEKLQKYVEIPGNAMLLNDSVKHFVPLGKGTRITMRIFGEIDYNYFADKIIPDQCYYL